MSLPRLILTNAGRALLAKGMTGATVDLTRIALGDGILSGDPAVVTALVHEVVSVTLSTQRRDGERVEVSGPLLLESVAPFYWRELAIMAIDPDEGEVAYGYSYHESAGGYIDPSVSVGDQQLGVNVTVGDVQNVTVRIDSSLTWVTVEALEADKGAPGGVAGLDENGVIIPSQLPPLDFIHTSEKGAPNGVATLNAEGYVESALVDAFTKPQTLAPATAALYQRTRRPLSSYAEGETIYMQEGDSTAQFYVAKHDYEPDLNGQGRTLLVRKHYYRLMPINTTPLNAYATSEADNFLNTTYKALMSESVRASLGTTFRYTPGNGNNVLSTLQRDIFILSLAEFGLTYANTNVDGTALPIAATLRTVTDGTATLANQWTRTSNTGSTTAYSMLATSGVASSANSNGNFAIRPALTLPDDYLVEYDDAGRLIVPNSDTPDGAFNILSSAALIRRTLLTVKRGGVLRDLPDGGIIYLAQNGALRPFWIPKHDYEPGLNGAGRVLLFDIGNTEYTQGSSWTGLGDNRYVGGIIDNWLQSNNYLGKFSPEVRQAMGQTNIRVTAGYGFNTVSTVSRAAFLLAANELGVTVSGAGTEGTLLPTAAQIRIAQHPAAYATRTPIWAGAYQIVAITATGTAVNNAAIDSSSIRPAFTLPEDFEIYWYETASGGVSAEPQYANIAETVLGENIGGFTNMEMLEYVGTGAYGATNPNTISFNFRPDLVIVQRVTPALGGIPWLRPSTGVASFVDGSSSVTLTWADNGISWYGPNVNQQLNGSGQRFTVIAFGR